MNKLVKFFFACICVLVSGMVAEAKETMIMTGDKGLLSAMHRIGCSQEWLSVIMRHSNIQESELGLLRVGRQIIAPDTCDTEIPTLEDIKVSRQIIHYQTLLINSRKAVAQAAAVTTAGERNAIQQKTRLQVGLQEFQKAMPDRLSRHVSVRGQENGVNTHEVVRFSSFEWFVFGAATVGCIWCLLSQVNLQRHCNRVLAACGIVERVLYPQEVTPRLQVSTTLMHTQRFSVVNIAIEESVRVRKRDASVGG